MLHRSTIIIATIGTLFLLGSVTACTIFARIVATEKADFIGRRTERAEAKSHRDSFESLERALKETKAERASLTERIVREEDVITLLALIEALGREQGVGLTTNALTVETSKTTFETLVISVTIEGSFDSVMQTLRIFEHLPYQSTVSNVQVGKSGDEKTGSDAWKGSFQIRVTKYKKT